MSPRRANPWLALVNDTIRWRDFVDYRRSFEVAQAGEDVLDRLTTELDSRGAAAADEIGPAAKRLMIRLQQIQLHAVDPNTQINIVTPPPADQCTTDDERAARAIYDSFPPGLQRALASESLDEVNKVLGKMSVDEAEQVVEQLGNGVMLSLEEGVIDATTEEGQKAVEEYERQNKARASAAGQSQAQASAQQQAEAPQTLAVDELD